MTLPTYPTKPRPGDTVALVSPSSGLPGILPLPYELGRRRLREDFKLNVTEVKAVIASIGGDDQITVLPHLDRDLLRAHPKPFFGYSDNTSLLAFLYNLGIVAGPGDL